MKDVINNRCKVILLRQDKAKETFFPRTGSNKAKIHVGQIRIIKLSMLISSPKDLDDIHAAGPSIPKMEKGKTKIKYLLMVILF